MCVYLFKKLPNHFPKWLYHGTFSPAMYESSSFSIPSQFSTFCLDYNQSSRCEAVSHCGLIYISLVTNDVEPLFMGLLDIHVFSLVKCLFKSFVHFFLDLILNVLHILWIQVLYELNDLPFFLPVCELSSHFLNDVFWSTKVFNFNEV